MAACLILLRYLTDTSVSPLQKEFVEIDDPYASEVTVKRMSLYKYKICHICFMVSEVAYV